MSNSQMPPGTGPKPAPAAAPKILVVDDLAANIIALKAILRKTQAEVIDARSGQEALRLVLHHEFALVLMDVQMPEMDGFEIASLLRQYEGTEEVPIVFVTALSKDDQHIIKGCQVGAVDFLFKPLNAHLVLAKVQVFLEMYRLRQNLRSAEEELEHARAEFDQRSATAAGVQDPGVGPC